MSGQALGWGILGAARIADVAVAPAIAAAGNGRLVAIASRDRPSAELLASRHAIPTVHDTYDEVLHDPHVDAVYNPLVNSLHRDWTLRALAAGKHVLCEKPLAVSASEAVEMAAAADAAGCNLMEAIMYRFHPRVRAFVSNLRQPRLVQACFGFPLRARGYRSDPALGGGALLDVGCYVISLARWILGEPVSVAATGGGQPVDRTVAMALGFPNGAQASLWVSFETAESQEVTVVDEHGTASLSRPFTSHRDPHDPYQLMVEAFARAALAGQPSPVPPQESIANLRVLDWVRAELARTGSTPAQPGLLPC